MESSNKMGGATTDEQDKQHSLRVGAAQTIMAEPSATDFTSLNPLDVLTVLKKFGTEYTAHDVFMWRNPCLTLALFLLGNAIFALVTLYNYSIISIVSRILFMQVFGCFVYVLVASLILNKNIRNDREAANELATAVSRPNVEGQNLARATMLSVIAYCNNGLARLISMTDDDVDKMIDVHLRPAVETVLAKLAAFVKAYLHVLQCRDMKTTLKFVGVFHALSLVGSTFSITKFLYLAFLLSFTLPKAYSMNQREIDSIVQEVVSGIHGASMKAFGELQRRRMISSSIKPPTTILSNNNNNNNSNNHNANLTGVGSAIFVGGHSKQE